MTQLLADPIMAVAALVVVLLLCALVWAHSRRPFVREIERLRDDLHNLLASSEQAERIPVNGRLSAFVDITASMNRLLDRGDEAARLAQIVEPPADDRSELFDALADTLPEVALIHTQTILYANRAAGELFGVDPDSLIGKPITDLLRPAYRAGMRKHVGPDADGREPLAPFEVQLISNDDQGIWAELHSRRIEFQGEPALLTVARDITHRKSLETSLGRGKLQARITLESIGEGVITTDRNGTIDYMNEAAEQLIGGTRSAGIGKRLLDLLSLVDEIDRSSLGDPVAKCLSERRRVNLGRRAFLLSKQAEREFSTELTASPIRGPDGQVAGCVVIFHDVSELRGLAREMSYQASHDALTGLVNRTEFERRLETALTYARRRRRPRRLLSRPRPIQARQRYGRAHRRRQLAARDRRALEAARPRFGHRRARRRRRVRDAARGLPARQGAADSRGRRPSRRRTSVRLARPCLRHRRQRGSRRGRQGQRLRRERPLRGGLRVLHREAAGPRPHSRLLDAR